MFCFLEFKFRTTGCPCKSNKKKLTNWNFCETFQHWLIQMFIFCCARYELLFLLMFPRNATPISVQHNFLITWWGSEERTKLDRAFCWQIFCCKVLISIILYWLQFHNCVLSDCFIIHHSVKVSSWPFITRRTQSHVQRIYKKKNLKLN